MESLRDRKEISREEAEQAQKDFEAWKAEQVSMFEEGFRRFQYEDTFEQGKDIKVSN